MLNLDEKILRVFEQDLSDLTDADEADLQELWRACRGDYGYEEYELEPYDISLKDEYRDIVNSAWELDGDYDWIGDICDSVSGDYFFGIISAGSTHRFITWIDDHNYIDLYNDYDEPELVEWCDKLIRLRQSL